MAGTPIGYQECMRSAYYLSPILIITSALRAVLSLAALVLIAAAFQSGVLDLRDDDPEVQHEGP
jgi:hypothetical protein